ncbi:TonB-dependent receptor domain-containing protein [Undibacterium umbellatum]|uniref:TonB-dependent receptor n=1 Tax=Undibacterium umbellatum TaxID=2762300 RepID=A0ABR6Z6K5_9BURK|nr:TonB-dependent receptor [Undibacterium umbellatum]MBC3907181.1 TonB-dependent receptor [Undibacterium umbellatum]
MIFKEKIGVQSVRLALSVFAGSMLIGGYAHAQTEAPQRIEITGSNIKRADKEGTSPIQTITAKEIKQSGATTVLELLKNVPSMGTGGYNDTPDQNGFSRGVATASLRGLGSTSTLILLNGRRMTPSAYANPNNGQSTLYDLNSIPISAIEKVEIFKDGASAIYGSDAVAGVINFITKRDYQGGEVSANISANDDREFGRQNVNGTIGFGDYSSQGYNVLFAVDYRKQNATTVQNGSNDIEAKLYSDINFRLNPYSSSISNQAFFYKERTPGALSFFTTGATVINQTNCDASRKLVGGPEHNIAATSVLRGRTFCNYDLEAFTDVQSKGDDVNFMTVGNLKINDKLSAFGEFAYTDSKRVYRSPARSISGTSPTTNFLVGGLATPFQAILPVGHPDNPNKDARSAVAYRFENLKTGTDLQNESARLVAGLKGSISTWDWESAVLWNRSKRNEVAHGFLYLPTLRKLITDNRSLASLAADPTISPDLTNIGTAEITQWDGKATTEFGSLGGGAIGFAAGFELRQEKLKIDPDPINARGDILGLSTTAINAQRNVSSAFLEFRTPFLKNFEMDFAGRYDKYPSFKGNFVPKVGAKWTVTDGLAFRGTYAEGFRAPALSQVAAGGAQFFLNGTVDPIRCPNGANPVAGAEQADCSKSVSGVGGANPELKPEKSKSYALGMIYSPSSNFDVVIDAYKLRQEGEVALSSSTFLLEHPADFPADYIVRDTNPLNQLKDANGNPIPGTGPLLAVKTPWVNQGSTEVSGVDVELKLRNNLGENGKLTTSLKSTYLISYRRAEAPGDTERNAVGTNGGLNDWATSVGSIPRLRASLTSVWEKGPHTVYGTLRFTDSIAQYRRYDNETTYPVPYCHYGSGQPASATSIQLQPNYNKYFPDCQMASWTTLDLGYSYTGIKNLTLGLNIRNITDSKAPYAPGSNTSTTVQQGYNTTLHNNFGRYFTLSARYVFR